MQVDKILADTALAASLAAAAGANAVSKARDFTTSQMNQLNSNLTGALPYNPDEVMGSGLVGQQRVFASSIYQLTAPSPGNLSPLGVGDGSPSDQALLVSRISGHAAAAGCTGGLGGTVRVVTTAADEPTGTFAGTLRKALYDHHAAWIANQSAKSWIIFDKTVNGGVYNILLTAHLPIQGRNWAVDGRGAAVTLNGNGAPGPVPYGYLSASHTAGATTLTTSSTGRDFQKSRLAVGMVVDVISADGTRSNVYGSNLTVTAFDATAGTITVSGGLQNTAPTGATVLIRGKSKGALGYSIFIGGAGWNDAFGPGKVNIPTGNFIWHNIALISNWGGDVIDTGGAQDFCIRNWTDTWAIDHCTFSNPDPFHDILFNDGGGSLNGTVSWNSFFDHYKALNHFNSTDGSGGLNADGTFSKTHSFPPKPDGTLYTTADPGPYAFVDPGGVAQHGNSAGLPLTIETATWHHNHMYRLGQRAPKAVAYAEVHVYNNLVEKWGVKNDPVILNTIDFPTPDQAPTGGAATHINDSAKARIENNVYRPYDNASGGATLAIKHTPAGKSTNGYTSVAGNALYGAATSEGSYHPELVPDFKQRYSYTLDPPDALLEARILAGAGAGAQSALWAYVGPVTVPGGGSLVVKDEGTSLTSAASSVNFVGTGVTATATGSAVTVTVPGASSALTVKDEGGSLSTAVTSLDFVGTGVTATNTGGAVTVTVPGATTSVVAGQELAVASYWPSSGTQTPATTTSSTAHDIAADAVTAGWTGFTATSLDCTFTVPPSRVVDVRVELYCKGSAAGTSIRLALGDNTGTTLAGPNVSAVVANGTVEQRVPFTRRLDLSTITGGGPAAGSTFTLRPQWLANSGTGTIDVGGTNGPISMRVYAAL